MEAETGEGNFAKIYDFIFNPALGRVHHTILELASKYDCETIVDLGSGTGAQARVLSQHGFSVTGIDASYQMINVARNKSQHAIQFIHSDITTVSVSKKEFDAANISLVLHPNSNEIITKILSKAKELVKSHGIVFITDYGRGSGFFGKIAELSMQIIESFTKQNHRINYFSFMRRKGIDMFSTMNSIKILERKKYYNGALQTIVITFL